MILAPLAAASVVLWHSYHAAEQQGLEAAVQQWNRAHPEVPVEPQAIPVEGFSQKLEAAIPRGHGPDLYIAPHEKVGDWTRAGLVAALPREAVAEADFLPGTIAPLTLGGQLYGVPLAFKSVVMFYRTDLVEKPPQTTDEMLALCQREKQAGRYCLVYEDGSFFFHAAWVHGAGGTIVENYSPGQTGEAHLASPEGVRALSFVRRLVDAGYVPDEVTGALVGELFNGGKAALAINGPWFLGDLQKGVPFAIAPLPVMSETGRRAAPLLTVEAAMMPPKAAHPGPALAFARWLAGPEGARIRARVGRQPVADRATWEDPEIAQDPRLAAFRLQLDATVPTSNAPVMNLVWEPAQQALRRVLRGDATPQGALTEADRRIAIILRPPPPPASKLPFFLVGGLCLLGAGGMAWRRLRQPQVGDGDAGPIQRQGAAYAYLMPAMLAMLVLVFIPFAVGVGMSFCHHDSGKWRFIGLGNFTNILGASDYPITDPFSFYFTLVVTALWTVANVSLHVFIGVALALLLRDPLLKLRGVYRVLLIVPWSVPNYITALIWKGMFHRQFGSINALLKLLGLEPIAWFSRFATAFAANLTTNVWLGFPFMMVVTLGALANIPKELEEAAALDGASRWQRLRHVILPNLAPALVPAVVLGAVWTFNMFNVVFLVSNGEPDGSTDILISQAYRWAFQRNYRYGYAAAYAVLIFLVLAAQTMLSRRVSSPKEER
jgi:arabinogalactan oligomer/maltooligosaccharide transport system permease protein